MFGIFRKNGGRAHPRTLADSSARAIADVQKKWMKFYSTMHFKQDVSLAEKIDLFSQPIHNLFKQKYPELLIGGSEIFWLTIFTAILESNTYPKELVNRAVAELEEKYSPSKRREVLLATLSSFFVAARECACEMIDNSSYMTKEMQNVVMTVELRKRTTDLCVSLRATGEEVTNNIEACMSGKLSVEEISERIKDIVSTLSRDFQGMHAIVMELRAQNRVSDSFGSASLLVGESATNILEAYNMAGKKADVVMAKLQG